jgi:hypothetical protein
VVFAALLGFPASAGTIPQRHAQSTGVVVYASRSVQTVTTPRAIGASARTTVVVSFNRKAPAACRSDNSLEMECAWGGIIVTVTAKREAAPATVRVVGVRYDRVRVAVWFSWR